MNRICLAVSLCSLIFAVNASNAPLPSPATASTVNLVRSHQKVSVTVAATQSTNSIARIEMAKPDVAESPSEKRDSERRMAVLQAKVDDLYWQLAEQTGLFSAIIILAIAIAGLLTYRRLKTLLTRRFLKSTRALHRKYEQTTAKLSNRLESINQQLSEQDRLREDAALAKIEELRREFSDEINFAMFDIYRATAYALRDRKPESALLWMLRALNQLIEVKDTYPQESTFIKDLLKSARIYAKKISKKDVMVKHGDEILGILNALSIYEDCREDIRTVRVEINRIQSLEDKKE